MIAKLIAPETDTLDQSQIKQAATWLRIGLGLVFVVGGWWKLSRAISPDEAGALVESYMGAGGYINSFFADYLFEGALGSVVTPLGFLTLLSTFELVSGLALLAGFLVRPLSLIYALMLWTFVMALPVVTAPEVEPGVATYLSPALLVQIRDIGLSGLFFSLFSMGSGNFSLDERFLGSCTTQATGNWANNGLLLRLAFSAILLVGGFFAGYDHITSYAPVPLMLVALGLLLMSGHFSRLAGLAALLILISFIGSKINFDQSLWNNLNGFKRELGFVAAALILSRFGGGTKFRLAALFSDPKRALFGLPKA